MKLGDLIRLFDFVRSECKYYLMVPKISFWIEFVDANLPYVTSFTNAPTNLWFEPRVKKIIVPVHDKYSLEILLVCQIIEFKSNQDISSLFEKPINLYFVFIQ